MYVCARHVTLRCVASGHSFGETAITSSDGLRSAAAIAAQKSYLFSLEKEAYVNLLRMRRSDIHNEVLCMLQGEGRRGVMLLQFL